MMAPKSRIGSYHQNNMKNQPDSRFWHHRSDQKVEFVILKVHKKVLKNLKKIFHLETKLGPVAAVAAAVVAAAATVVADDANNITDNF
jgi:hypothetical protein